MVRQTLKIEGPAQRTRRNWGVITLFGLLGCALVLQGVTLYIGAQKLWKVEREVQSVWAQNYEANTADAGEVEGRFNDIDSKLNELEASLKETKNSLDIELGNQTREILRELQEIKGAIPEVSAIRDEIDLLLDYRQN